MGTENTPVPEGAPDDSAVHSDPQVQEPPETPAITGPWAKDLEFFEDVSVRGQVDQFLREKVQPRITQLEQAQTPEEAAVLYQQLQDDPLDTYVRLTEALYGEEASAKVAETLNDYYGLGEDYDYENQGGSGPQTDPELEQVKEIVLMQEREKAYNAKVAELQKDYPEVDGDLIAPFVVSAEGDWDTALAEYKRWYESASSKFTVSPTEVPEPPPVEAPQVLGGSPTTPPTEKRYENIDEALDDFFAEERAKQAPPVL